MIDIHDVTRRGETLTFAGEVMQYLGPNLTLDSCELVLRTSGRMLVIKNSLLTRCSVVAKKKLARFSWCDATLDTCAFHGTFSENDFGPLPRYYGPDGGIRGCDFSAAILDGCRFFACDPAGMKWPRWPCYTLLRPHQNRLRWLDHPWPGNTGITIETLKDEPHEMVAVTGYAPSLVKRLGGSEEELRRIIERLPDVLT